MKQTWNEWGKVRERKRVCVAFRLCFQVMLKMMITSFFFSFPLTSSSQHHPNFAYSASFHDTRWTMMWTMIIIMGAAAALIVLWSHKCQIWFFIFCSHWPIFSLLPFPRKLLYFLLSFVYTNYNGGDKENETGEERERGWYIHNWCVCVCVCVWVAKFLVPFTPTWSLVNLLLFLTLSTRLQEERKAKSFILHITHTHSITAGLMEFYCFQEFFFPFHSILPNIMLPVINTKGKYNTMSKIMLG